MPRGNRGSDERREKPTHKKPRKEGKTAKTIVALPVPARSTKKKPAASAVAAVAAPARTARTAAALPTAKTVRTAAAAPPVEGAVAAVKNNVLLSNPFKSGEKWGNKNYNNEWKALNSTEKKRRVNSLQRKLNAPKTKKNAMKLLDTKCKKALNIKIPYENKHSKRNKTKEVYITVENALEGCHTENSGCKFLHTACRKKGKQECRFSILKRQAIGILQKHCPKYFDDVKDFLVN